MTEYETVRFVIQKIPIDLDALSLVEIPLEQVVQYAAALTKNLRGKYITSIDIFGAYLLLTEQQTKLLFTKRLKPEELMQILLWGRHLYPYEEKPREKRVTIYGGGIGESLTTGWTYETKKFTVNYSLEAFSKKPQITGREKEFTQMLETLSKREKNNILLVGDPGSGRENLVALLGVESYLHTTSLSVPHIKILELMIGPLIAGAANRSELESRLQAIIDEVSHSGNVVIYIPEFQNITGSSSYEIDLSGALYPYLTSGRTPMIGSVSVGNFKAFIEKSSLLEAFTVIKLEEPDKPTAMKMVLERALAIEEKNNVVLTYKAIESAVEYADRFFQEAALPGSAVNVLEDVAHAVVSEETKSGGLFSKPKTVYILADHIVAAIQEKTHIVISQPTTKEKDILLHLEDHMHKRVIAQEDAIHGIAEAMRRLRAGMTTMKRPISFLFLGPTGVGKTETTKALAELYFGGEDKMIRLDMSEYSDQEGIKRLLGAPPGEGQERGELTDKIADHPFSLVLLDEFEKANPKIIDLFLQVLEDGRLTDNKGKTVSFASAIVIATSNAGAEFIREEIEKGSAVDKEFSNRLLDYLQSQRLFRPELINRFDDVVIFKPLGESEMGSIAKIMLDGIKKQLAEQDITFTYDDRLLTKVMKEGFNQQFGARPLRRYIQDSVEDIIAQKKLRDEIKRGDRIFMTTDNANMITVTMQ
jgi:ATP-dependent Clp protease ATP-binding subunit ClpC